ncbi:MAG: protease SohB [Pseudohongiellaceae bacterium]
MEFLTDYGLFLAKTLTLVLAILFVFIVLIANASRHKSEGKHKGHITVTKLNDEFDDLRDDIRHEVLDDDVLKAEAKAEKKKDKEEQKARRKASKEASAEPERKRIYVLEFDGDVAASEVEDLRHIITAILAVARPELDAVMLKLESPGGMVHSYGLAASQLARLRKHNIHLTICVDKVAASGGYMMACIANNLIAAPFAYIGSIGVLVQLPNVHRLLKDNKVDYEMITAGEYKRTLTTFGENTDKGREKVQEEVDEMHLLFKSFIQEWRPALDVTAAATGEVWTGTQSLTKGLIDAIDTSDEWLLTQCKEADVYEVSWVRKLKMRDRLTALLEGSISASLQKIMFGLLHRADKEKFYS